MQTATLTTLAESTLSQISPLSASKCNGCPQHNTCLSSNLNKQELQAFNLIAKHTKKINRGEYLYRSGDMFDTIYMIRSGSLKTSMIDEEGREQVLNFSIQGDIVGLNGLFMKSHITESKALETTFLCGISVSQYLNLATETPKLYQRLLDKMSSRIIEEEEHTLMLGTKNTDQRLASFLLNLIKRNSEHGFHSDELELNMSRRDIGNYLSAAVETVSRMFARLQDQGIIEVRGKSVRIEDLNRLEMITH